jgi:flavorubredoxin
MEGLKAEIKPGIYWIGVNDRLKDLFEAIWPLPRGISYNSYLVVDEKVAVIDTAEEPFSQEWYANIEQVIDPSRINYVVCNHMEPDHSGSLPFIRRMVPEATIVASKKGLEMVDGFYDIHDNVQAVADGDEISLGGKTLRFYEIPYVHWPETIATYAVEDKVLFSGDAFGTYGALDGGIFDDQLETELFFDEMLRYYSNVIAMYSPPVQKALEKLKEVPIEILGPSHGPIWRKDITQVIENYRRWSHWEGEKGIVMIYSSEYGNTRDAMDAVARGVVQGGSPLRVYDASRTHISWLMQECWHWSGIILGAPTYDTGIHLPMENLMRDLAHKRLRNRICGLFSSFSWSGGAMKQMREIVDELKWEVVEPAVAFKSHANLDEIAQLQALGKAVAERVMQDEAGQASIPESSGSLISS